MLLCVGGGGALVHIMVGGTNIQYLYQVYNSWSLAFTCSMKTFVYLIGHNHATGGGCWPSSQMEESVFFLSEVKGTVCILLSSLWIDRHYQGAAACEPPSARSPVLQSTGTVQTV